MRIVTMLFVALALLSAGAASAQETTHTLVYTDHEPLEGMRTRFINEVFFPAIERESNGRLKIEPHWGSTLSISYDALRSVASDDIADMAVVVPEYTPDVLPLHQVFKSFPVGPTGEKQLDFFHRVYAEIPDFIAELEKANLATMMICTGYPNAFFSVEPMKSLKDIRGAKYRSASFWHRRFLENAGAVPVTMPWNDGINKALRDGALDGVMVNVDSGYEMGIHKAAPHTLLSKDMWLGHVYLLVMNRKTWNGLAKEDREAIERVARSSYKALGPLMDSCFDAQAEELKKGGADVRILTLDEAKQWEAGTGYRKIQSAWVEEQEGKGVKGAGAVMEKVRVIMDDAMNQ